MKKEAVLTRLDAETVRRLDSIARDREWTRSHTVRKFIEQGIESEGLGGFA